MVRPNDNTFDHRGIHNSSGDLLSEGSDFINAFFGPQLWVVYDRNNCSVWSGSQISMGHRCHL